MISEKKFLINHNVIFLFKLDNTKFIFSFLTLFLKDFFLKNLNQKNNLALQIGSFNRIY